MNTERHDVLSLLFNRSPDPMLLIRGERFVDCNQAAVDIMGAESREQLLNIHPTQISPEIQPDGTPSSEKAGELFGRAGKEGSARFEWQHLKVNGEKFWVEVSLTFMVLEEEPAFYTVWRDITARKAKEAEAEAAARRLNILYEDSPDGILLLADGKFIDGNAAAVKALHASSIEEVRNTSPASVSPEYQPDGRLSSEKSAEFLEIAAREGSHVFEWVHRTLDGEDFWVEVGLSMVEIEGQTVAYSVWRDIGERKEAEARIREQAEAIAQLSTPVVKLWDQIVLLPVVGVLDTARSQQMTERVLHAVVEEEALVVLLDVTGVAVIDTSVARHILQTVESAKILGAEVVITGFSPASAQTLAQLGVDFSSMRTKGSLRAGVSEALNLVGAKILAG